MAAGLPVIALSEMGTADILDAGRGCFTPPDDAKAFGEVIGRILANPDAWGHLAAEARAYAAEWSDEAMAARLAALYQQLLCQAPATVRSVASAGLLQISSMTGQHLIGVAQPLGHDTHHLQGKERGVLNQELKAFLVNGDKFGGAAGGDHARRVRPVGH